MEGTSHQAQSGRDTEGWEWDWSVAESHGERWASVECCSSSLSPLAV